MPSACRPKSRRGKCLRPGPVGRNPYLNFLREFRKKCCGMTPVKTIQQGAKAWKQLRADEKMRYIKEAFYAPKRRRQSMGCVTRKRRIGRSICRSSASRRSRRRTRRSSCRPSSKRRSRSRKSQHRIKCNL